MLREGTLTEEWREADVCRVEFRLHLVLQQQGRQAEVDRALAEMQKYLCLRMGQPVEEVLQRSSGGTAELSDGDIMTWDHDRTAGIWSNGTFW